jgi:hypothetical protein
VIRRLGRALIADILPELGRVFAEFPGAAGTERVAEWRESATARLATGGPLLDSRGEDGRGHAAATVVEVPPGGGSHAQVTVQSGPPAARSGATRTVPSRG